MTRPMYDSVNIFGIHEPGGEEYMAKAGHPGWILFTEGIGSNPQNKSGRDYRAYSQRNFGIICRLNNGYAPATWNQHVAEGATLRPKKGAH